ncbi:MAG: hypothetical protein GY880_31535 [Planctomycetaceae bacterium]|nr:hypothetical protein [Planctomycetaceae bacterium]MCP4778772.1 hypothetical protein [Planctomycetaceae bacterium]
MAKFNVAVPHGVPRQTAATKLRSFADQIRDSAAIEVTDVQETWDDDGNLEFSFKAMGMSISGTMTVCEDNVTVAGTIPFAALPFRGAIESQIAEKIREAIG